MKYFEVCIVISIVSIEVHILMPHLLTSLTLLRLYFKACVYVVGVCILFVLWLVGEGFGEGGIIYYCPLKKIPLSGVEYFSQTKKRPALKP